MPMEKKSKSPSNPSFCLDHAQPGRVDLLLQIPADVTPLWPCDNSVSIACLFALDRSNGYHIYFRSHWAPGFLFILSCPPRTCRTVVQFTSRRSRCLARLHATAVPQPWPRHPVLPAPDIRLVYASKGTLRGGG